jgi:hypothetical protein
VRAHRALAIAPLHHERAEYSDHIPDGDTAYLDLVGRVFPAAASRHPEAVADRDRLGFDYQIAWIAALSSLTSIALTSIEVAARVLLVYVGGVMMRWV